MQDLVQLFDTLTTEEAVVLTVLFQAQPSSVQQVIRGVKSRPTIGFKQDEAIEMVIDRLGQRKLIDRIAIYTKGQRSKRLTCNRHGTAALRSWIFDLNSLDMVPIDPVREKVRALGLLSFEERAEWISNLKISLNEALDDQLDYRLTDRSEFDGYADDYRIRSLKQKLDWLDDIIFDLVQQQERSETAYQTS